MLGKSAYRFEAYEKESKGGCQGNEARKQPQCRGVMHSDCGDETRPSGAPSLTGVRAYGKVPTELTVGDTGLSAKQQGGNTAYEMHRQKKRRKKRGRCPQQTRSCHAEHREGT